MRAQNKGGGPVKPAPSKKANSTKPATEVSAKSPSPANLRGVPRDMRDAKRWIVWRYVNNPATQKRQKKPVGRWRDPECRRTYADACTVAAKRQGRMLGFVLGDGWSGIDVDGAWPDANEDNGLYNMRDHARVVWDACKGAYVERSPSGTGFKVFMRFEDETFNGQASRTLPELGEHVGTEIYCTPARWFAVTGNVTDGCGSDPSNPKARKGWHMLFDVLQGHQRERVRAIVADPTGLANIAAVRPYTRKLEADLRAALAVLPSEDRNQWQRVGHALKAMKWAGAHAELAFDLFHEWSMKADKYEGKDDCREKWEGFDPRGEVGVSAIFALAKEVAGEPGDAGTDTKHRKARRVKPTETGAESMAKYNPSTDGDPIGITCPVGVVMLASMGGLGKSTICATDAMHVTTGAPCPPWEAKKPTRPREPADVLWLTTEESMGEVVLPRHGAIGGDMSRIRVLKPDPTEHDATGEATAWDFDIEEDLRPILLAAQHRGTPIRLVVCDTLTSLVNWGRRSPNSDADVKQVLGRLKQIADEFGCCIKGTHHWNKKGDDPAESRMTGSTAWRNHPRIAFMCEAPNNDGSGTCFLYMVKGNEFDGYYGVTYKQEEVKLVRVIEAETADGKPIRQALRRIEYTSKLMRNTVVLDLLGKAKQVTATERNASKPPTRNEEFAAELAELFDILGDELPASTVWNAYYVTYGRRPNSDEKQVICKLAGIQGARGKPNLRLVV